MTCNSSAARILVISLVIPVLVFSARIVDDDSGIHFSTQQSAVCDYNYLTCLNGGTVPSENCVLGNATICGAFEWSANSATSCECDPKFQGATCGLVSVSTGSSYCSSLNKVLDTTVVNSKASSKYMECSVDMNGPISQVLTLVDHRTEFMFNYDQEKNLLDVTMDIYNRPAQDSNKDGSVLDEVCSNIVNFIHCEFGGCSLTASLDKIGAELSCSSKNCTTCPMEQGCSSLLGALFSAYTFSSANALIDFTEINTTAGSSKASLPIELDDLSISFDFLCSQSQCSDQVVVSNIGGGLSDDNETTAPTSANEAKSAIFAIVFSLFFGLIMVSFA